MLNPQLPSPNDKETLALVNANSKAINTIFYGVSPDEFHRISYIKIAKEA